MSLGPQHWGSAPCLLVALLVGRAASAEEPVAPTTAQPPAPASARRPTAPAERPSSRWRFGVELDPIPFLSHGYSLHGVWKPGGAPRWRFTFGSFGLRGEPSDTSTNVGFTYRETAFETSASYFVLDPRGRGLFVGLYGFVERFLLTYEGLSGEAVTHSYRVAPATGYQFLPWTNGPYVTPWISLAVQVAKDGPETLGGHTFHQPTVGVIWGLHFGGEFETF
jgi:hypothetical protein